MYFNFDVNGDFIFGDYVVCGSYENGYDVYHYDDDMKQHLLYYSMSLENCIMFCVNS